MDNIRNFCIIAHVDHGKSTLADRFLEMTGTVEKRHMKAQYLDQLESERERGITIKMAPVRMVYHPTIDTKQLTVGSQRLNVKGQMLSNSEYILNLIDTPGHSDFSYEVSRALAAVDGAILLVDVTQGIQAQTLANFNAAKKSGLTIIGAVNKIDISGLSQEKVHSAIESLAELLEVDASEIFKVSGKTGQGAEDLLSAVIKKIPPPKSVGQEKIFRALIFDSFYHEHKGIVAAVRVFNGGIKSFDDAHLIATNTDFKIKELGYFAPELKLDSKLENGQIGYIATGLKDPEFLKIGDTVFSSKFQVESYEEFILSGYKEPQPVVYVSFYPEEADDYENLKSAFGKLKLNDSALRFEPDFNEFLGRGFKTGFLGKLHFEITVERLEKEFHLATIHSFPSVSYKVKAGNGEWRTINNPKDFPDNYLEVMEPIVKVEIITPPEYLGSVMGMQNVFYLTDVSTNSLGKNLLVTGNLPLSELIRDFDDQLKSVSAGYASLSYEVADYQKTEAVKMSVLVAEQEVSGLTRIVHKVDLEREARKTVERLKDLLPKQQFAQAIQACAGSRIIARENIPAMKKLLGNFGKTGGDRTRKMKLWKKQKKGKEKLKELAAQSRIEVPANVFKELLKK